MSDKKLTRSTIQHLRLISASKYAERLCNLEEHGVSYEGDLGLMLYTPAGRYIGRLAERKEAQDFIKTDGDSKTINLHNHIDVFESSFGKISSSFEITEEDSVVYFDDAVFIPNGLDQVISVDNATIFTKQIVGYSIVDISSYKALLEYN